MQKVRCCYFDAPLARNHYFWGSGATDWEPVGSKVPPGAPREGQ